MHALGVTPFGWWFQLSVIGSRAFWVAARVLRANSGAALYARFTRPGGSSQELFYIHNFNCQLSCTALSFPTFVSPDHLVRFINQICQTDYSLKHRLKLNGYD